MGMGQYYIYTELHIKFAVIKITVFQTFRVQYFVSLRTTNLFSVKLSFYFSF